MIHRRQTIQTTIAVLAIAVAASLGALAQQPAPVEAPEVEGQIEYVGPDTFILLDADGRPQPVLGMTYEEFVAAWKKLQFEEASAEEPRYTIDELRIVGQTTEDHGELEVEIAIRTLVNGPIRVPLGMIGAILREQPRLSAGTGAAPAEDVANPFVGYDAEAGGFVARIDGQSGQRFKLMLRMLLPLVRNGNETSLRLNCPRALVSGLELEIPTQVGDATATEGALLKTSLADHGGTRLEVNGLAGDFRLSWAAAEAERPELATVLSATGAVAISIDGHSIRSDAQLTVRSYGGSFDRFRVRLPPGAKLIQDRPRDAGAAPPSYRITVEEVASSNGEDTQVVTVELAERQLGPVEIDLSTEQPLGLQSAERAVELAGFEVLGAVRQYGDVAVQVADDWQLRWENGPYVRQVERAELAPMLDEVQPTAAFQYDRQPWSLRARIVARPMVVHVTPDYVLDLDAEEARLRAHFTYQVPGARAFEFHVRLQGWELTAEPIESNGLVDRDGVMVTRDGVLVLPLAQASSRRAEVSFQLRRAVARDAAEVSLPLPVPEADSVAAAELSIVADTAIELLPSMTKSRGLSPIPVTNETPLDVSDDGRQVFRYRSFVPDSVFVARRSIRPSEVTAEVESAFAVDWRRLQATQEIAYRVEHQPIEQLVFDVPSGWSLVDGQLEILPANGLAEPFVVAAVAEQASHGRPAKIVRATLPQPRLGTFRARLAYEFVEPSELLGVGQNVLPLPLPAAARIIRHRAKVTAAANLAVSLGESASAAWQEAGQSETEQSLELVTRGPQASLPLAIEPLLRDRPQATTVVRAWLQTWQVGGTVQDRAVFQFQTTGRVVTVELPPQVAAQEVEVLADGELAEVSTRQEGRLIVEVPPGAPTDEMAPSSHTLELRYRWPAPIGLVARHEFTPPQLVGSTTLSEVYWQVVLPGDRHIVHSPGGLISVEPWQWLEVFGGRRPTKSQEEMEVWSGASRQSAPSAAQNIYLYSGLAPVASIEVLTAPRWLIVLATSGAVLALVSVWMYVPIARRGWLGLLIAAIVAGLAVAYPAPAVLLGQAAVLGAILAAVALLLQRRLARPVPRPPTTTGSTNMRMRSSLRTDSYLTPSLGTTGSGMPTMPLAAPEVDR